MHGHAIKIKTITNQIYFHFYKAENDSVKYIFVREGFKVEKIFFAFLEKLDMKLN